MKNCSIMSIFPSSERQRYFYKSLLGCQIEGSTKEELFKGFYIVETPLEKSRTWVLTVLSTALVLCV